MFPDQAGGPGKDTPPFKVEANWEESYFYSAKVLIVGVAQGTYSRGIEGVAGLYLFRHYLELGLKYLIFHARWLKDAETKQDWDAIVDVKDTHNLGRLWAMAQEECRRIIPDDVWHRHDIPFLDACIKEFDAVDPGTTFRYHGKVFGVEKDPGKRELAARTIVHDSFINFEQLAVSMDHVYEVLSSLDVYVYETHGQLVDWEAEWQDSADY